MAMLSVLLFETKLPCCQMKIKLLMLALFYTERNTQHYYRTEIHYITPSIVWAPTSGMAMAVEWPIPGGSIKRMADGTLEQNDPRTSLITCSDVPDLSLFIVPFANRTMVIGKISFASASAPLCVNFRTYERQTEEKEHRNE